MKYNVCTYCDDDDNDNLDVVRRHCALPSLWRSRRLHWQCVCLGGDGDVGDHGDELMITVMVMLVIMVMIMVMVMVMIMVTVMVMIMVMVMVMVMIVVMVKCHLI